MMIFGKQAMNDHQKIGEWLTRHITRLSQTSLKGPLEGVDSIDGLISCGRERTIDKLIPAMEKHMCSIDNRQEMLQLAERGDPNALYSCYLGTFTLDYLRSFAIAFNLKSSSINKPLLIAALLNKSTIEEFNAFVIDNDLRTGESCASFQTRMKKSKTTIASTSNSIFTPLMAEDLAAIDVEGVEEVIGGEPLQKRSRRQSEI